MTAIGPKRGDLDPPLKLDITAESQVDFNLALSWRLLARRRSLPDVLLFTDTAPGTAIVAGSPNRITLTHNWVAGETSIADVIQIEAEVTWPGGKKQTFPRVGYVTVVIDEDLG